MRILAFCLGILALVVLGGCARPAPLATNPSPAPQSTPFSAGTILSMRAVSTSTGSAPWRAALLAAASGSTGGSTASEPAAPLIEFIVRADDGATLSIVQPNNLDLHMGDRVMIRYEPTVQLARPS